MYSNNGSNGQYQNGSSNGSNGSRQASGNGYYDQRQPQQPPQQPPQPDVNGREQFGRNQPPPVARRSAPREPLPAYEFGEPAESNHGSNGYGQQPAPSSNGRSNGRRSRASNRKSRRQTRKEKRAERRRKKGKVLLSDQISDVGEPLEMWDDEGHLLMRFSAEVVDNLRLVMTRMTASTGQIPTRLAVTSALPGEGVTYVSRALATVMAHDLASRVALVELNWWSPAQPPVAPPTNQGLVSVVTGEKRLDEIFVNTAMPNLTLIPGGFLERGDRPIMARSNVLKSAIDVLDRHFDYLIFDIPAIRATNDSVPLAMLSNGVMVVIQQGTTPVESVRQALDEIQHLNVIGTMLNQVDYKTPNAIRRVIPQD